MPDNQWQKLLQLIFRQSDEQALGKLLTVLMTPEERESVATRLAVLESLLRGDESQREMAARLGVSIAKVTRGSNNVKALDQSEKDFLMHELGINE